MAGEVVAPTRTVMGFRETGEFRWLWVSIGQWSELGEGRLDGRMGFKI